jgi:hypothetical protein
MSLTAPLPTENDLAISPELAILATLRVAIQLAAETLRVAHPINDAALRCHDGDTLSAAIIVSLAEALRLAIVDYEQRMAGLHSA